MERISSTMEDIGENIRSQLEKIPFLDGVLDDIARNDIESALNGGVEGEKDDLWSKLKKKIFLIPVLGSFLDGFFGSEREDIHNVMNEINKIQEKEPSINTSYVSSLKEKSLGDLPEKGYLDDSDYVNYLHHLEWEYKLPINTLVEVCRKESNGVLKKTDGSLIGSSAGAQGLFQFMPNTAKDRYQKAGATNARQVLENPIYAARAAAEYLAHYGYKGHDTFNMKAALIAYNNGPKYKDEPIDTRPAETQDYYAVISAKVGYA